jgi:hypothetical protein
MHFTYLSYQVDAMAVAFLSPATKMNDLCSILSTYLEGLVHSKSLFCNWLAIHHTLCVKWKQISGLVHG